jgi:hypothetical protein
VSPPAGSAPEPTGTEASRSPADSPPIGTGESVTIEELRAIAAATPGAETQAALGGTLTVGTDVELTSEQRHRIRLLRNPDGGMTAADPPAGQRGPGSARPGDGAEPERATVPDTSPSAGAPGAEPSGDWVTEARRLWSQALESGKVLTVEVDKSVVSDQELVSAVLERIGAGADLARIITPRIRVKGKSAVQVGSKRVLRISYTSAGTGGREQTLTWQAMPVLSKAVEEEEARLAWAVDDGPADATSALVNRVLSVTLRTDVERDENLFALLSALRGDPAAILALLEQVDAAGGERFQKLGAKQTKLSDAFSRVLSRLGRKEVRDQTCARWREFGADPGDIDALSTTLDDLMTVFHAGPGPHQALVLAAGNWVGDIFGLAAALVLNPKLHVTVLTDEKVPDWVSDFLRQTLTGHAKAVHTAKLREMKEASPDGAEHPAPDPDIMLAADLDRVHVLHVPSAHPLYAKTANGKRLDPLPYEKVVPPLPELLRSYRFHRVVGHGTQEVAALWDEDGRARQVMRTAWGLEGDPDPRIEAFLRDMGVPVAQKYVVLWSRFSGKQRNTHPEHDTSLTGLKQIIDAIPPDVTVLIAGDKRPSGRDRYRQWAEQYPHVHDVTAFWETPEWRRHFPAATRSDQFKVFDHLVSHYGGALKHFGFRSGNLEPYALIGHEVRYLEETGSMSAARMEPWSGPIGYRRITVSKVPTLTGQWVLRKMQGKTANLVWRKASDVQVAETLKAEALGEWGLTSADRGFTYEDLAAIGEYLGFTPRDPAPGSADPKGGGDR